MATTDFVNPTELMVRLRQAAIGDALCWQELIAELHPRLRRLVALRMDQRLNGRIDPSDVLQEAYMEAAEQLAVYLRNPAQPFFLWLRFLVNSRLNRLHRYHLAAQMRDASREIPIYRNQVPEASSMAIADQLIGRENPAMEEAAKAELRLCLHRVLEQMDPLDREALALRHFEQLSGPEVAQVLGISVKAAGKRYLRALERLKGILIRQGEGQWT